MAQVKPIPCNRRRRRWIFADCVFDESNWSLEVAGRPTPIETKPLELLRELLLHHNELATKEDLLARVWRGVTVVEASLPTAIHKIRLAIKDEQRSPHIIQTVPRIGYRLVADVVVEETMPVSPVSDDLPEDARFAPRAAVPVRWAALAAGIVGAISATAMMASSPSQSSAPVNGAFTQQDAADALRKVDIAAIERMLRAGWNPNLPFDDQGNGALNLLLNNCEWDPGHDQGKLLLMARTLIDGGNNITRRNVWGDTPYSIAKAERYCGPHHPVTKMIHTLCYAGHKPAGDRCLASYELTRRRTGKTQHVLTRS